MKNKQKIIPLFKPHYPKGIGNKIENVFKSGIITEGVHSDKFEKKISSYISNKNSVLLNSCTSALTLAYHLSDIKENDEVITTPFTCMATNEPLINLGAKIKFADIEPLTGNISAKSVENLINKKTKAIVATHWAGQPFEIKYINQLAAKYNCKVIEDAAQALGAKYNNQMIGNSSDFVCFSFQAIKHLTTVDGGLLSCNNKKNADRAKLLRWFGLNRDNKGNKWNQDIKESGYKFHMNNVLATIGIEQMKYINNIIGSHKKNGKFFDKNIQNIKIEKFTRFKHIESSYWTYPILVDDKFKFKKFMHKNRISCDEVTYRNDKYTILKKVDNSKLPGLEYFAKHMVNIPVGWWLTEKEKKHIVDVTNSY